MRRGIEGRLRTRIERDIEDGLLPPETQAAALAGLVLAVTQGMSVLARDGATRASLLAIVQAASHAWPPMVTLMPSPNNLTVSEPGF